MLTLCIIGKVSATSQSSILSILSIRPFRPFSFFTFSTIYVYIRFRISLKNRLNRYELVRYAVVSQNITISSKFSLILQLWRFIFALARTLALVSPPVYVDLILLKTKKYR